MSEILKVLDDAWEYVMSKAEPNDPAALPLANRLDHAAAVLRSHDESMVLVPREPTPDMLNKNLWIMYEKFSAEASGNCRIVPKYPLSADHEIHLRISEANQADIYKAMISAIPEDRG